MADGGELPTEAYVSFSAEITPSTGGALIATMVKLANRGVQKVTLALSIPGGSRTLSLAIYNTLRGMPLRVVTHNVGTIDPIGSAIFLAGAEQASANFHAQ